MLCGSAPRPLATKLNVELHDPGVVALMGATNPLYPIVIRETFVEVIASRCRDAPGRNVVGVRVANRICGGSLGAEGTAAVGRCPNTKVLAGGLAAVAGAADDGRETLAPPEPDLIVAGAEAEPNGTPDGAGAGLAEGVEIDCGGGATR